MPGGQDFISLGLDISGFDDAKFQRVEEFIKLFNKLDKYDGKAYNVVLGNGLVEFNKSISDTSKLLDDINSKLSNLTSTLNGTSGGSSKAASGVKALTAEQAKLKVQIQEVNKNLIEQAKAQNASVQAKVAALKATAEQARLEKELAEQIKKKEAEFERARKQAIAQNKEIDAQSKKSAQDRVNLDNQIIRSSKEKDNAEKQLLRSQQDESRMNKVLLNDYELLRLAQRDQATNYANLFIAKGGVKNNAKDDPSVKAALLEYENTSTVLSQVDKQLDKVSGGANAFGRNLGHAFGQLRTLAYILPGLGIAGIFNLAFEAIGKVVEQLDLFGSAADKYIDSQIAINKALQDFVKIEKEVEDAYKTNLGDVQALSNTVSDAQAAGKSRITNLSLELELQNKITNIANAKKYETGGFEKEYELRQKLNEAESTLIQKRRSVSLSQQGIHENSPFGFGNFDEREKKELELAQLRFDIAKEDYVKQKHINEDNASQLNTFNAKSLELKAAVEEEKRKLILETSKIEVANVKDVNEKILDSELKTQKQKVRAIQSNYEQELKLQKSLLAYTLSKPDAKTTVKNDNGEPVSSYTTESLVAIKQNSEKSAELLRERNQKEYKLNESYRQQRLKDISEINQAEIQQDAERDEKITNNEEKTIVERLDALNRYILAKQKLQDIQLTKDLDQDKFKTGDYNSFLGKEALKRKAIEQQANIQADVEKKVYDIVYQSTQKQLKLVLDENRITIEKNKETYGEKVRGLTDSFSAQKISYTKYKKELKKVDEKYEAEALDATIIQNKQAVENIKKVLDENLNLVEEYGDKKNKALNELNNQKSVSGDTSDILPKQKDYDEALAMYNAYSTSVKSAELALSDAIEKKKDAEFKRNNLRLTNDLKQRQNNFRAIKEIEQAVYEAVKTLGDKQYENRSKKNQLANQLANEQYSNEIAAIEKSSLSAKDKAALDIQINAEKQASDKQFALEEKRIKYEQAVFDRDIAIAHIILSTAEAIASLIEIPVLAIAAGVAGAAQLAIAIGTSIPAYEKGVKNHPGGYARTGEGGKAELIVEPYKSPYLVFKDNISYLPPGTDVIPMKDNPSLGGSVAKDDGWKQTIWLAKQIKKSMPDSRIVNNINIDLGIDMYKKRIIGR